MSNLKAYLTQKREAIQSITHAFEQGKLAPSPLKAVVSAEGRSGVRRIRIRDFQVISDSPPSFAGYDLGPSSPELQLGVLGSCLTHTYLIQAAIHQVPLEALEVEVTGEIDPRAGRKGHEATPPFPHNIAFEVRVTTEASEETLKILTEAVEKACPILNLLRKPQTISHSLTRTTSGDVHAPAA